MARRRAKESEAARSLRGAARDSQKLETAIERKGASKTRAKLPIYGQHAVAVERSDAARNRASILDAARKLLKKRPIGEICMDELAQTAGVGKGTLYRRFADRSSLCRALLHDESLKLQARTLRGFDLPPNTPWVERLGCFLDALFEFVVDNAVLLSEAAAFERGGTARFDHPAHAWQRDETTILLKKAGAAGELSVRRPEIVAELILALLDPDLIEWHIARGATRRELRDAFHGLWRQGLLHAPELEDRVTREDRADRVDRAAPGARVARLRTDRRRR